MIWLGGGACHIDTWDPKRIGDPSQGGKKPGSAYRAIDSAVAGVQVCEHLPRCADLLDRFVLMRTVSHAVNNEHAVAVNMMHTGRPTSGTVVYPSIGSIVSHQRGSAVEGIPPYVLIGYPNLTRGPGFLGGRYGYLYLTDTESGPAGLVRPADVDAARQEGRTALLGRLRENYLGRHPGDEGIADYDAAMAAAFELSGPEFSGAFKLANEPDATREAYGSEFGQRCLVARRLVERGVRFVEVSHNLNFVNGTGWDTHRLGQLKQHELIHDLDQSLSTLVADLERCGLLDRTLIVVSTEFGRPATFDGEGGRGHHSEAFSVALAGGGLLTGQAIGDSGELGMKPEVDRVSVPDLFATIFWSLGIDPTTNLYAAGDRPVPITDGGQPVRKAFV